MENRTCTVKDCTSPLHLKGLCIKHYARMKRHGSTDDPRPARFGEKRDHPFYVRWAQLKRRKVLSVEWLDFWRFVTDVSPQPDDAIKMRRLREDAPYGPRNWGWVKTPTREENLAYLRDYHQANYHRTRESHFQAKYGISLADYEAMCAAQGYGCAICHKPEGEPTRRGGKRNKFLAVDHCHETGHVRGLLCTDCNVGIGYFGDSPARLEMAAAYIANANRRRLKVAE